MSTAMDDQGDVSDALDLAEQIDNIIEDRISDQVKEDHSEFFEGVSIKARDIAATITRTRRVSAGQLAALTNMLAGVSKWLREDD